MPLRNVLVLDAPESPWPDFLREYLEDTPAEIVSCNDSQAAAQTLDKKRCDLAFLSPPLLSLSLTQKLKAYRQSRPEFRLFGLGPAAKGGEPLFHENFEALESLSLFQKRLLPHLPMPEKADILVVDDEPEIGAMIRDFLENRTQPTFFVDHASNGKKALEALEKKKYDLAVLDIKMPEMDGRELYREIRTRKMSLPVIVFFDAVTQDELADIHQSGRPPVVDKGSRQSAMPEMMQLIKKMIYFG